MKLYDLLNNVKSNIVNKNNVEISALSFDSKEKRQNCLYFCLKGTKVNGENFACDAIKNGAVAIVCERRLDVSVPQIVVKNCRKAMAKISSNFFGNPGKKLKIIGITGTNGKTSTSYIIADLLKQFGKNVGVIGTSGIFFGGKKYEAEMTTPDCVQLFDIFAKMVKAGVEYCIMEVSAHAIFFEKVYSVSFCAKLLTNVKTDHLDFFKTQQNYENVKKKFFASGKIFVINYDDKIGRELCKMHKNKCISFGKNKNCDIKICNIKLSLNGSNFCIKDKNENFFVKTNLTGIFNVYNCFEAYCTLKRLHFSEVKIAKYLSNIKNLQGRMDIVFHSDNKNVIIDYAHTFDSLKNLLVAVKSLSSNKNVIVFGCPGERDAKKRFLMGKLAGEFCKTVIVTTDNPASENPRRIMFEIMCGVKKTNAKCLMIEDRENAIKKAVAISKKDTNILIVGKGTESCQIVGDKHFAYSDYAVVEKLFSQR